jgi:DNA polymerase-3 subunit gamma/tau
MGTFVVSARKYRPDHFDTVVGQPSVTNTLKNAIRSGQIAHAYLFCGPRGVGKTTCARIFAKTLNCFNLSADTEACEQCESCKSFNESRSYNIHELDAASNNSVDDIRSLIDKVRIIPQVGKYSIYIIDEVHMLSQAAFNAFLKTLEEPPEHAIFILATTEKHKIIPTILSRCQIFDFHRIRVEDIVRYLSNVATLEHIAFEEEALNVIALKADGAMRDALSIFDQVASFSNKNITYQEVLDNLNVLDYEYFFKITEIFLEGASHKALLLFNEILQRGFDGQNFIGGLASHLRDLMVCRDESTVQLLEVSEGLKARYVSQAKLCSTEFLMTALEICNQCELGFKANRNQRLHVELSLIKLCNTGSEKKNLISEQKALIVPEISRNNNESHKPVSQVVEILVPQAVEPVSAPERQALQKPSGVKEIKNSYDSSANISIKDALKASQDVLSSNDDNAPDTEELILPEAESENEPISPELLSISWNSFAGLIREDRPRMAVTLKSVQPKIQEDCIVVELNNGSQLDDFNVNMKSELERFLQHEMHNRKIRVVASVIESEASQKNKLYTSEEKFRYLSQKNPVLSTFRQMLNLELE